MGARGRIYLNETRGRRRRIDILLGSNDAPKRGEARRVSQPSSGRLEEGRRSEGRKGVSGKDSCSFYDAGAYVQGA
jgi:hypothetical protein